MRRREFITLISSAAMSQPARAQQAAMPPMIGFLSSRSPGDFWCPVAAFRQGLGASGSCRGAKCRDRLSLGGGPLRPVALSFGGRTR